MPDKEPLIPRWVYERSMHQDAFGIYFVLNDLFEYHPEVFGSEDTRQKVADEVNNAVNEFIDLDNFADTKRFSIAMEQLNLKIVDVFKDNEINPLGEVSVAHIDISEQGAEKVAPLAGLMKRYETTDTETLIYSSDEKAASSRPVTSHHTHRVVSKHITPMHWSNEGKFDYVITGNVVNSNYNRDPLDMFATTAMLLKEGGKAIHLTSASDMWHYSGGWAAFLNNDDELEALGQTPEGINQCLPFDLSQIYWQDEHKKQSYTDPATDKNINKTGSMLPSTSAVILRQEREIDEAPDFAALRAAATNKDLPAEAGRESGGAFSSGGESRTSTELGGVTRLLGVLRGRLVNKLEQNGDGKSNGR